jgi:serine/threonine-protein kinase
MCAGVPPVHAIDRCAVALDHHTPPLTMTAHFSSRRRDPARDSASSPVSGSPASGARRRVAGDFDLLRPLGSGAMGEVWLGRHRVTGGLSAVKLLHPEGAVRERVQRFFARERRAVARLTHPHIVALHDLGPGYIATAYIDGSDLGYRMQTPIAPEVAVGYALQIASALAYAHSQGVVHRDVKPSNILVDRRGNAYLADFGLALVGDEDDGAQERAGTPAFMAPEQAAGRAGPAADQYALARTLLEMLAGVPLRSEEEPFAQVPATTPPALLAVIRRAMARDPAARFASVAAFADALAALDLDGAQAPMRLAPEQRVRSPFKWAAAASDVRPITREIKCADYKLGDLARAGVLTPEQCEAFRAQSGYEEMAWTVYAHEGRLGPIASDGAFARASDLVVILHGILCNRHDWHDVATEICRDNAQAIVLVPDLFGSNESRLREPPTAHRDDFIAATVTAMVRWLELLSVRDLPTVIVGHSLSGTAILTMTDEDLGERTSRVVITPSLATSILPFARASISVLRAAATFPMILRRMGAVLVSLPEFQRLTAEARGRLRTEFERAPAWVIPAMLDSYAAARPAPATTLQRCAVLIGTDDIMAFPDRLEEDLATHGFPRDMMTRVIGSGHYPHAHVDNHPETRARNIKDITRKIDEMLASSREGAPLSTYVASTVLGDDTSPDVGDEQRSAG